MNDLLLEDSSESWEDIEVGSRLLRNTPDYDMQGFFKKVAEVEKLMSVLSHHFQMLQEAKEEYKCETKASAMQAIKKRMEKDVDEAGNVALLIRAKLQEIDEDNLSNRDKPGCGKGTGVDRSRMSVTNGLKKELKDRMTDFEILIQTIRDGYREIVRRRVFIVTGGMPTDEIVDGLIDTGKSERIFRDAIEEIGRDQVTRMVEEILERHDHTVKEMERRLLDFEQVMNDMKRVQPENGGHRMMIAIVIILIAAAVIALSILKPWK